MKIIRAGFEDTDIFSESELNHGACCFFSEDRTCKYFFEIKGQEAILHANTGMYTAEVIDEFLFYSGFITLIKTPDGDVLLEKATVEPRMFEVSKIQPSQFYISDEKLARCKRWITGPEDIHIPVVIKDGICISLDGHTRLRAAIDLGYPSVYVYPDECDEVIFRFVAEAVKRNITSVYDMEIVGSEEYKAKWDGFCDCLLKSLGDS